MAAWWPFGRRRGGNAPAADAAPPASLGDSAPTGAWRSLPPLRPSAPPIELTAPVQRLAETITPARHVPVSDGPLGHARPADAPAGVVAGLLKPRPAVRRELSGSAPLIFVAPAPEPVPIAAAAPLRRRPGPAAVARVEPPAPDTPPAGTTHIATATVPLPPLAAPATPVTAAPLVSVQRVSAAPTQLPAVRPRPMAVRVEPSATGGLPVVRHLAAATPEAAPAAPAPDAPTAAAAPASAVTSTPTAPAASTAPLIATGQAPFVGTTRVVRRIGEPLRERPASMVATPVAPALPVATPPGVARMPEMPGAAPRPSLPAPGAVPARPARHVAAIDTPRPDPDAGARPAPAPSRRASPLVGARPPIQRLAERREVAAGTALGTGVGPGRPGPARGSDAVPARWPSAGPPAMPVQRTPEGVPADLRAELEPVLDTALSDVKVHRDADTGEAARELRAKAFTAGGEVFLPDWHGPTSSGEARSILAHELTHVAQQRRLGSALPAEDSPAGASLESEARAVAGQAPPVATRRVAPAGAAAAAGRGPQRMSGEQPPAPVRHLTSRQPSPEMSPLDVVARVRAAATAAGIATEVAPAPTAVPTAGGPPADIATEVAPAVAQRLPDGGPAPQSPDTPATSPAQSSAAAPAPPTINDPVQLEELARRLYPRFRTRLRQDLLADRERTGRLFDMK